MTVPQQHILGVDGGQSEIRVRSSHSDRTLVQPGVSHGDGDVIERVSQAVSQAIAGEEFGDIDRVVMGLTTVPAGELERRRQCQLVADATAAPEVWLTDDTVTAHAGALAGSWGISLAVGTGVACLAMPPVRQPGRADDSSVAGSVAKFDGHGYLLGDDGGGFWIGRRGINAVLRATERRGPPTILAARAATRYQGLQDLDIRLHSATRPVNDIAQFARDVIASAIDGDDVALQIIDAAVQELAATVDSAARSVGLLEQPIPVAMTGRLVQRGELLRTRLEQALTADRTYLAIADAAGSSLDGAITIGLDNAPQRYDDLIFLFHNTRERI